MNIEFSEDPEIPLNKMIKEVWETANAPGNEIPKEFITKIRNIYEIGFNEGQSFVWKMRRGEGRFIPNDENDETHISNNEDNSSYKWEVISNTTP
jgi:hypothetical protein